MEKFRASPSLIGCVGGSSFSAMSKPLLYATKVLSTSSALSSANSARYLWCKLFSSVLSSGPAVMLVVDLVSLNFVLFFHLTSSAVKKKEKRSTLANDNGSTDPHKPKHLETTLGHLD